MAARRGIFVIAGYGTGAGTGSASAFAFAKEGYKIAILGRSARAESLDKGAQEIKANGGDAHSFPVPSYAPSSLATAFSQIKSHWPTERIRVGLWNAAGAVWKPFLEITEKEWEESMSDNVLGPAAFSRELISVFKDLPLTPEGARGTLLFTGATSSIRGNKTTSSFSAGKFALRSLSQSLAKEFGKQNIHVAHAVMDGGILTERSVAMRGEEWGKNEDVRLSPEGIAQAYVYLAHQPRSTWTWELDLRPAHENW